MCKLRLYVYMKALSVYEGSVCKLPRGPTASHDVYEQVMSLTWMCHVTHKEFVKVLSVTATEESESWKATQS